MSGDVVTELRLAGDPETLLSHMALLGTGMILEEQLGAGEVLCRWSESTDPAPLLHVRHVSDKEVDKIIRVHAARLAASESFLRKSHDQVGSLFSARTKTPKDDAVWREVLDLRDETLVKLRGLNSQFVVGIGERAWWRKDPDDGASAWEMRPRNHGAEFIATTVLPLAENVAQRSPGEVVLGLTGDHLDDELGNNERTSLTGTGLGPVGPTDNARAWVALWAIACMPVWPQPCYKSQTSASLPGRQGARQQLLMPMCTSWVTVSRWRATLRSQALLRIGDLATRDRRDSPLLQPLLDQLAAHGFGEVLRFPIDTSGGSGSTRRHSMQGVRASTP